MVSRNHIFLFFSKACSWETGKYMYHLHSVDYTITQKICVCVCVCVFDPYNQ